MATGGMEQMENGRRIGRMNGAGGAVRDATRGNMKGKEGCGGCFVASTL